MDMKLPLKEINPERDNFRQVILEERLSSALD
jgi:hypothetical protein